MSLNLFDQALQLCTFSQEIESKNLSAVIQTLMSVPFD